MPTALRPTTAPMSTEVLAPPPPMTAEQRRELEENGFVMVPGALGADEVDHYVEALDEFYERNRRAGDVGPGGSLKRLSAVHSCPPLVGLLDHPSVFPLIWSVLGWNIHVHHSHVNVHPTVPPPDRPRWRWHQDGSRQCLELETDPAPRMSVFVSYWLSDMSEPGRGNLTVIPGSHRRKWLPGPPDASQPWPTPEGAIELTARPGDAVLFDRRLWHARSDNHSAITRKAVFLGYTFRWIARRDDIDGLEREPWFAGLSPIRQQLLGVGEHSGEHQWGMSPDDVPLYAHLRERDLLDPANRLHRRYVP